jgi:hypothetical protein
MNAANRQHTVARTITSCVDTMRICGCGSRQPDRRGNTDCEAQSGFESSAQVLDAVTLIGLPPCSPKAEPPDPHSIHVLFAYRDQHRAIHMFGQCCALRPGPPPSRRGLRVMPHHHQVDRKLLHRCGDHINGLTPHQVA